MTERSSRVPRPERLPIYVVLYEEETDEEFFTMLEFYRGELGILHLTGEDLLPYGQLLMYEIGVREMVWEYRTKQQGGS